MALTATPHNSNLYKPAYNEIVWVVSGSNVGQPNFRYLAEIYDGANTTKLVPTIKVAPRSTDSLGIFDFHRILESYISSALKIESVSFAQNSTGIYKFSVRFGEEYGTTVAQTLNITNSTGNFVLPLYFEWLDFQTIPGTTLTSRILNTGGASQKFLTDSPHASTAPLKIRSGQNAWLFMLNNGTANNIYLASISVYDSSDALIHTHGVVNAYTANTDTADRFLRFPAGPNNLNTIPGADYVVPPVGDLIPSNAAKYSIQMLNVSAGVVSEVVWYTIDDTCTEHPVYRLHFLNKLGGYDSFNFIRKSFQNTEVERKKYKQNTGGITSGVTWGYNKYDRVNTVLDTKYKDRVTVNTDWISEAEAAWLKELFTSPDIFYEQSTSVLVHVNPVDTSYQTKTVANERLIQYAFTFEFGYDNYRQRA